MPSAMRIRVSWPENFEGGREPSSRPPSKFSNFPGIAVKLVFQITPSDREVGRTPSDGARCEYARHRFKDRFGCFCRCGGRGLALVNSGHVALACGIQDTQHFIKPGNFLSFSDTGPSSFSMAAI